MVAGRIIDNCQKAAGDLVGVAPSKRQWVLTGARISGFIPSNEDGESEMKPIKKPQSGARIYSGAEADRRLLDLSLNKDGITAALQSAMLARSMCNENNARNAGGSYAWHAVVHDIRDKVVVPESGWRRADPDGVPLIVHDRTKVCIAFMTGDNATGLRHLAPKPKRKKPWLRKLATSDCQPYSDLFGHVSYDEPFGEFGGYSFWILLIAVRDDEVSAELSLIQTEISGAETFLKWPERILLPQVFQGEGVDHEDNSSPDDGDDIDFDVPKKTH